MKQTPLKESNNSKKMVLTVATDKQELDQIYNNIVKNLLRQGVKIHPDKKENTPL